MERDLMNLKILLPYGLFAERKDVVRVIIETRNGSFGFLPNRLDCTAALAPGILAYETISEGIVYVAVDEGVVVKSGRVVSISVRNAIGGRRLGHLRDAVEHEFLNLEDRERNVRSVLAKLESGFIKNFQQLINP